MTGEGGGSGQGPVGAAVPEERIVRDFEELAAAGRLFGAELNPAVLKKSGSGASFLAAPVPPVKKLLARWARLFANRIAPKELFFRLSAPLHDFGHRDGMLLFGKDRLIYDAQIAQGEEAIGGLTLFFLSEPDRRRGSLAALLTGRRIRTVYIDRIHLAAQSSGYASDLFRRYETLFHALGFNRFRLKASLSVGKYYWAKEGFDCEDRSELVRMRKELRDLVREKGLPVGDPEIQRLNHAYDIALFRRDLSVPVYRNAEGYYSFDRDAEHREEILFPLGKAFLLCSMPWDGYKIIYTNTRRRTGLVYSPTYLAHDTRAGHPEGRKRLRELLGAIRKDAVGDSVVFLDPYLPDRKVVEMIHRADYLERFRESAAAGSKYFGTRDCAMGGGSYEVALLAAGGVMAGVDAVLNRRVDNIFCAVRPPGHHAAPAAAMGFCFINNVAVGAAYARAVYGVERIFILDWDVHHGNGTQAIFDEDPRTYFCSIHEHPTFCFPGTGRRMERGRGEGNGATLNIPLAPHAGDREFLAALEDEVFPEIERFRPELIMISAGFDAHRDDRIADLELTEEAFARATRRLCEIAEGQCGGRIVSILEGGYHGPSLAASVIAHLKALQGRE